MARYLNLPEDTPATAHLWKLSEDLQDVYGLANRADWQLLSQIKDERIVQSIFGNVGTLISFRVGRADAEILAPQFTPLFDFYDLANLPNWQACMKTTVGGQVVPPFTLHTCTPASMPDPATAGKVRQCSRLAYGRPRVQVEQEIAGSLGGHGEDKEE